MRVSNEGDVKKIYRTKATGELFELLKTHPDGTMELRQVHTPRGDLTAVLLAKPQELELVEKP